MIFSKTPRAIFQAPDLIKNYACTSLTVTMHSSVTVVSSTVIDAVIVALPASTPVTLPVVSTVALVVSLDDHVTVWFTGFVLADS